MGVSCILQWNQNPNESSVQAEEGLLNHLISMGAKMISAWNIDCEHYSSIPSMPSAAGRFFQVIFVFYEISNYSIFEPKESLFAFHISII